MLDIEMATIAKSFAEEHDKLPKFVPLLLLTINSKKFLRNTFITVH